MVLLIIWIMFSIHYRGYDVRPLHVYLYTYAIFMTGLTSHTIIWCLLKVIATINTVYKLNE